MKSFHPQPGSVDRSPSGPEGGPVDCQQRARRLHVWRTGFANGANLGWPFGGRRHGVGTSRSCGRMAVCVVPRCLLPPCYQGRQGRHRASSAPFKHQLFQRPRRIPHTAVRGVASPHRLRFRSLPPLRPQSPRIGFWRRRPRKFWALTEKARRRVYC